MDEFKKYINQHRQQLDTDEPSDQLFESIEKRLISSKASVVPMFMKWAAAACIILLVGVGIYMFDFDKSGEIETAQTTPQVTLDSSEVSKPVHNKPSIEDESANAIAQTSTNQETLNHKQQAINRVAVPKKIGESKTPSQTVDPMFKAFSDMDKSYASMVSLQLEKVKGTPIYAEDAEYFHIFKKQFHDLSNDEKGLKEETKKYGINDDIIMRMINIYQEKISLLKQLQFEINKMNNRVKNSNADVQQKQSPTYINL